MSGVTELELRLASYHSTHAFRTTWNTWKARPAGDARRLAELLSANMRSELITDYHRSIIDSGALRKMADAIAVPVMDHARRDYDRATGVVSSSHNEERFMGPRSAVRHRFQCRLEMRCHEGIDRAHVQVSFDPESSAVALRSLSVDLFELRSTLCRCQCAACGYRHCFRRLTTEAHPPTDACPVCSALRDQDMAPSPRHASVDDLIHRPEQFHLSLVTVDGTSVVLFEKQCLLPPDVGSPHATSPVWLAAESLPFGTQQVNVTGVFLHIKCAHADPGKEGLISDSRGFGHMCGSESVIQVRAISER